MQEATTKLKGFEAIAYAEAHELTLSKYTDPIEDAREGLTPEEARQIALEDPSLIYLEMPQTRFSEQETIALFVHSYQAEFPDDERIDTEWSGAAYQEFKTQHPESRLTWREFHDALQAKWEQRR